MNARVFTIACFDCELYGCKVGHGEEHHQHPVTPIRVARHHMLHRSANYQPGYTVTHLRSGFAVVQCRLFAYADELLTRIDNEPDVPWLDWQAGAPWDGRSKVILRRLIAEMREAVR